jgi:hypothetical protein
MQAVQHPTGTRVAGVSVKMLQDAEYSLDNGITITVFDEGEFYRVPQFVADSMIARGWARLANDEEVPEAESTDGKELPPLQLKKRGKAS